MHIDVRGAVIHNIQHMSEQELADMVDETMKRREEKLLPGLGVLFEIIWKYSDSSSRNRMIQTLHRHLPEEKAAVPDSPAP